MKIGVTGCAGRMGKMLLNRILTNKECELSGGSERRESGFIGRDIGEIIGVRPLNLTVTAYPFELFEASDAVIDFPAPAATIEHAKIAAETGKILVTGTTGLTAEQMDFLKKCAEKTVIIASPNMSVGVNLLFSLVKKAAAILDPSYDIEIVEMHHRNKADAPSGTALGLGKAAAEGRQTTLNDTARYERHGNTGVRPTGEIGFAALRGGDVVGDHTVVFAGLGERIELTHKASSREIFADGAIRAALWGQGKAKNLYTMSDVLGLN